MIRWRTENEILKGYINLTLFLVASYLFLRFLIPYLFPFVLAIFMAVLIDPVVTRLEMNRVPRSVGAGFLVSIGVAVFLLLSIYLLVRLGLEMANLIVALPELYERLMSEIDILSKELGAAIAKLPPGLRISLEKQASIAFQGAQGLLVGALSALQTWLQGLPNAGATFLIAALSTYFISSEKDAVRRFILSLMPDDWHGAATGIKSKLLRSTVGLLKAQAVMVAITFVIVLGVLVALGVNYSLTIALLSALMDVLPVLGPGLIFLPWGAYAFLTGNQSLGFSLLGLYGTVALVRGVLQPRIIGERIGLHPLATLVALYIGVKVFGAAGFIYGPLIVIILKAVTGAGLISIGNVGRLIK